MLSDLFAAIGPTGRVGLAVIVLLFLVAVVSYMEHR
jgi:hypothetical protein